MPEHLVRIAASSDADEAVIALRSGRAPFLFRVPTHANGGFELTWVQDGELEFEVGRGVLTARAGDCVVLPPGVVNTPRLRAASFCQLHLSPARVAAAADALGHAGLVPADPVIVGDGAPLPTLLRLVAADAKAPQVDPGLLSLLDAAVFSLVRAAPERSTYRRIDRRIRRALDRIAGDWQAPLSVDDLADAAGMGRSVFLRTFRAQVGESPYRHLTHVRLAQAAEQLRRTTTPVLEIALDCGFGDPGRFARQFRARYGCTPREFRRRTT